MSYGLKVSSCHPLKKEFQKEIYFLVQWDSTIQMDSQNVWCITFLDGPQSILSIIW